MIKVQKTPCNSCPFRKDTKCPPLREYMTNMVEKTVYGDSYHVCHQTHNSNEYPSKPSNEKICAGKLIFENTVNPYGNRSTRMLVGFKAISPNFDSIKNHDKVFSTLQELNEYHKSNAKDNT